MLILVIKIILLLYETKNKILVKLSKMYSLDNVIIIIFLFKINIYYSKKLINLNILIFYFF